MDSFESLLLSSAVIVALAALGLAAAHLLAGRICRIVQATKALDKEREQQLVTLVQIAHWVANVLIVTVALLTLLSTWGVDVAPLLAGAGVAGLAVGLGAQTLLQDLIGGFIILIENQYAVGDVIQIGGVSGTVEQITLRATRVRDINGNLHIIPNGEARIVSNLTKDWSRALVDVGVAYEEDLNRVIRVLENAAAEFARDRAFEPQLLEPPQVLGPVSLGDWAVTVRVMVKTRPGEQWGIARELQQRILAACERENITLPYPRQEILVQRGTEFAPPSNH